MGAVDLVITFFSSTPLLRKLLVSRLVNPVYEHQAIVDGPVGTTKYDAWVNARGGLAGVVAQAAASAKAVGVMKKGDRVGRVALVGFSEGNAGVRACLRTQGATAVDAVFSLDGMHSMYVGGKVDLGMLMPWIGFARLAVRDVPNRAQSNGKLLCVTHSMIVPTGFAPVSECAPIVWEQALDAERPQQMEGSLCAEGQVEDVACTGEILDYLMDAVPFPNDDVPIGARVNQERQTTFSSDGFTTVRPSIEATSFMAEALFVWPRLNDGLVIRRHANGMHIYGWAYETPSTRKDPTGNRDHIFQGYVAGPYLVASALAMRWNVQPAVSGFGALGGGDEFARQPQGFLPGMGPDAGAAGAVAPISCPLPDPGFYLVGSQFDPCAMARASEGELVPGAEGPSDDRLAKLAMLLGGGALGWALARRFGWRIG